MIRKNVTAALLIISSIIHAQPVVKSMLRLPDTGQFSSFTNTFGEDHDYMINTPYFIVNNIYTVTDTITGLMWERNDGGEMRFESAITYCDTLTLDGYTDWRLPTAEEAYSILNQQYNNPALDMTVFRVTTAEYWWTSELQANDTSKVWSTNAGGGIGNHRKTETISAGGIKRFHARAVRDIHPVVTVPTHFNDNGDGTITDLLTELVWQKIPYGDSITWEQALIYADTLTISGQNDWRLPNIKELQSINDETRVNPSLDNNIFQVVGATKYWSSTSLPNQPLKAWYLNTQFGITTYDDKTIRHNILVVRGNTSFSTSVNSLNTSFISRMIYPNPFVDRILIQGSLINQHSYLMNINGEIIYDGCSISDHDFSELPKGIYFLLLDGPNREVCKLLKVE